MDLEQSRRIYQLLDAIVRADGVVTPAEQAFLRATVKRLRLPEDVTPESLRDVGSATTTLKSLDPETRTRVLALLVEAAIADGSIQPEEHAILLAAAAALGVEATALEERIARRMSGAPSNPGRSSA